MRACARAAPSRARGLAVLALVAAMLARAAVADGAEDMPGAEDRAAIRGVIQAQLDAFRADDAERAFGYASPDIQARFGTAERFMEMVVTAYRAVYRPRAVFFQDLVMVQGAPAQRVLVMDPQGRPVLAVYPMQRQPDGSWRIDGCYLFSGDAQML